MNVELGAVHQEEGDALTREHRLAGKFQDTTVDDVGARPQEDLALDLQTAIGARLQFDGVADGCVVRRFAGAIAVAIAATAGHEVLSASGEVHPAPRRRHFPEPERVEDRRNILHRLAAGELEMGQCRRYLAGGIKTLGLQAGRTTEIDRLGIARIRRDGTAGRIDAGTAAHFERPGCGRMKRQNARFPSRHARRDACAVDRIGLQAQKSGAYVSS